MRSVLLVIGALLMCPIRPTSGNTCGGNCGSDTCPSCPCGIIHSYTNITNACALTAGWSQDCCECIVKYESGCNLNAQNYMLKARTYQIGLWQIDQNNWASCNNGSAPCSLSANLNCAIKMFQNGGNTWTNWPSCRNCDGCCFHS